MESHVTSSSGLTKNIGHGALFGSEPAAEQAPATLIMTTTPRTEYIMVSTQIYVSFLQQCGKNKKKTIEQDKSFIIVIIYFVSIFVCLCIIYPAFVAPSLARQTPPTAKRGVRVW